MKLTRRDALIALGGAVGVGGVMAVDSRPPDTTKKENQTELTSDGVKSLVAAADVVYPSEVEGIDEFVSEYVTGLPRYRQSAIEATIDELNRYSREIRGRDFREMTPQARESVLKQLGVHQSGSDPEGDLPERVRYDIVNQVLFGLFSSPKGGRLVGITNPVGYPGGYQSYQRSPSEDAVVSESPQNHLSDTRDQDEQR